MPGDSNGMTSDKIRDNEESFPDTRAIGYKGEMAFGSAICSLDCWGEDVIDEAARLLDPEKEFVSFEDMMMAGVDGRPLGPAIGDTVVDEGDEVDYNLIGLIGEIDDDAPESDPLAEGKILSWHGPKPLPEMQFSGYSRWLGKIEVLYRGNRQTSMTPAVAIQPIKISVPVVKKTSGLEILGSILKKAPYLYEKVWAQK